MTLRPEEAGAMLADVDSVVARVKQSRIYRAASELLILWGALIACGDIAVAAAPRRADWAWFLFDALGVGLTTARLLRLRRARQGATRFVATFALFAAFGLLWSEGFAHLGARELAAFWPTLFLFGYALAGLWFGAAFTAIGVSLTALIALGYCTVGDAFPLYLALVNGGGLVLCGLAMRRA